MTRGQTRMFLMLLPYSGFCKKDHQLTHIGGQHYEFSLGPLCANADVITVEAIKTCNWQR